jgi:hypothetical protein
MVIVESSYGQMFGGTAGVAISEVSDLEVQQGQGTPVSRYSKGERIGAVLGVFAEIGGRRTGVQVSADWSQGSAYAETAEGQGPASRHLAETKSEYIVTRVHLYFTTTNRSEHPFALFATLGPDARILLNESSIQDATGIERNLKRTMLGGSVGVGLQVGRVILEANYAIPFKPYAISDQFIIAQAPRGTQLSLILRYAFFR